MHFNTDRRQSEAQAGRQKKDRQRKTERFKPRVFVSSPAHIQLSIPHHTKGAYLRDEAIVVQVNAAEPVIQRRVRHFVLSKHISNAQPYETDRHMPTAAQNTGERDGTRKCVCRRERETAGRPQRATTAYLLTQAEPHKILKVHLIGLTAGELARHLRKDALHNAVRQRVVAVSRSRGETPRAHSHPSTVRVRWRTRSGRIDKHPFPVTAITLTPTNTRPFKRNPHRSPSLQVSSMCMCVLAYRRRSSLLMNWL